MIKKKKIKSNILSSGELVSLVFPLMINKDREIKSRVGFFTPYPAKDTFSGFKPITLKDIAEYSK